MLHLAPKILGVLLAESARQREKLPPALFLIGLALEVAFDCFLQHSGQSSLAPAGCGRKQSAPVLGLDLDRRAHTFHSVTHKGIKRLPDAVFET